MVSDRQEKEPKSDPKPKPQEQEEIEPMDSPDSVKAKKPKETRDEPKERSES